MIKICAKIVKRSLNDSGRQTRTEVERQPPAHRPRNRPATPSTSPANTPLDPDRSAAFCRPGSPDVAAAPAASVGTAVSVMGALTTTRLVLVTTVPSGMVE